VNVISLISLYATAYALYCQMKSPLGRNACKMLFTLRHPDSDTLSVTWTFLYSRFETELKPEVLISTRQNVAGSFCWLAMSCLQLSRFFFLIAMTCTSLHGTWFVYFNCKHFDFSQFIFSMLYTLQNKNNDNSRNLA
jgi:hypothetical protein